MRPFLLLSLIAYAAIVSYGLARRSRFYATFMAIILGIHTANSTLLEPLLRSYGPAVEALVWWGQISTYLYFSRLVRHSSQLRPYRYLVAWPASYFSAAVFIALPWAIAAALGFRPWWPWLPFAIAALGFVQSISTRREVKQIVLDGRDAGPLDRYDQPKTASAGPPLRIVQITDPHLGTFMSEARLTRICMRAVAQNPDLIVLTGDFLTIETQRSPDPLARALMPLRALPGRVFACMGNHDHECPELVRDALARAGVQLLEDATAEVALPWGKVQIVGADHHFRDREARLLALAQAHPRQAGALRLWLLHDPGGFRSVPEGEADLVLSGHTHGGHLGLLSLGLEHTIVSTATSMPDHGVWARGRDRLYVHRGTGHYGFPLRIGVPAEESVLEIRVAPAAPA